MTSTTIKLEDGNCYYRIEGPANGPLLLLLHGATVPGWIFDRLTPLFNTAGWRTLAPDFYGHGYSARPRVNYDYELFQRQIIGLLSALNINQPIALLGHSMGAAVAARLVNAEPHRFNCLVLAAPLLDFSSNSLMARIAAIPMLGEVLMPIFIKPMLMRRRAKRYRNIEDGRWVEMFRQQLKIPGFGYALLSMIRQGTLANQSITYELLATQAQRDILIMRGCDDVIFPHDQFLRIRQILPKSQSIEIEATQHAFVLTDPDKLVPVILKFLKSSTDSST